MRRFVKYAVAILVLVIVAMISMLITMRFAIHRREVVIPSFVGMLPQAAEQDAASKGLVLIRENRFYSNEIPEGRIVSQEPPAGVKVRKGWRVRIAESMGPQRMKIPSVLGDSPRAAELNVKRRGLELGTVAAIAMPGLPPDQVVAQSPQPESQDVATPKVSVLVSAPLNDNEFVMPDLSGLKLREVTAMITGAGFKVGAVGTVKTEAPSPDPTAAPATAKPAPSSADAIVVRQTPAAGQKVTSGTSVNLQVAPQG
jgi:beta-lactam-binding protein with PASTA domain